MSSARPSPGPPFPVLLLHILGLGDQTGRLHVLLLVSMSTVCLY